MDVSKLVNPDFVPDGNATYPVISELRNACDVLEVAHRNADEKVQKQLVNGVVIMLQNVLDVLKDPEAVPEPDEEE